MPKKINIKGPIIDEADAWFYNWFNVPYTSPKCVMDQLPDCGEDVEVLINSGGGNLYAGIEIYTRLKDYKNVTTKIVGLAGSAASIIAMAGDKVEISPGGQVMIHNVSCGIYGDNVVLDKEAEVLRGHDESVANIYALKTGRSSEELKNLMAKETWMNAQEALEAGFVDSVMFQPDKPELVANFGNLASREAVSKLRDLISKEKTAQARLEAIQANKHETDKPKNQDSPFMKFLF